MGSFNNMGIGASADPFADAFSNNSNMTSGNGQQPSFLQNTTNQAKPDAFNFVQNEFK